MAFKFYTPIETQADNVGFYNASLAAQQQEYERQKQIEAGLQSQHPKIRNFWIGEAKKAGMLDKNFAPDDSKEFGSPLRTAQKYQSDIALLKEKSKGASEREFIQNAGEAAYTANMKKAGLSIDPTGTGYMYQGKPIDADQAYALMDQAAGRGNARIGEGGKMTDTGLAQSDVQKKMAIQESGDISKTGDIEKLNKSIEQAGAEPIGFRGTVEAQLAKTQPKVSQEGVTAEIAKRDEQKAIDMDAAAQKQQADDFVKNVTVGELWDQSGNKTFNTNQRYGLIAEWIDNNVKDPAKHEQMMRELMRMPEAQKYVGYRGADLGLDEEERLLAMKGRRGGGGGGTSTRRYTMALSGGGLSNKYVEIPKGMTLQSLAKTNAPQYFETMKTAMGTNNEWRSMVDQAERIWKENKGKIPASDIKEVNDLNDLFKDQPVETIDTPNQAAMDKERNAIASEYWKNHQGPGSQKKAYAYADEILKKKYAKPGEVSQSAEEDLR